MTSALLLVALTISTPCAEAFGVEAGEEVPCSGVLLPLMDATESIQCLNVSLPRTQSELAKCEGTVGVLSDSHEKELGALKYHVHRCERLVDELSRVEARPWWDSPAMGFGAGVLVTTATVVALLFGKN